MVETIQTGKETSKTEARVETATAKTGVAADERADIMKKGNKTKTTVTGIKTETQADIREATKSETIMLREPKIKK